MSVTQFLSQLAEVYAYANKSTSLNYTSTADFVLDRGKFYTSKEGIKKEQTDYIESIAVAVKEDYSFAFEPKQCFGSSMLMVMHDYEHRLTYCEGYAATTVFPVHHAWCLLDGEYVIDLVLRVEKHDMVTPHTRGKVLGAIPDGWEYFGTELPKERIREYIVELGQVGSLIEDWERGFPCLQLDRLGNHEKVTGEAYEKAVKAHEEKLQADGKGSSGCSQHESSSESGSEG